MATFDEAVEHVLNGGRAWEQSSWDDEAYLYSNKGVLRIYYTYASENEPYKPDDTDKNSTAWELF